MLDIAILWLDFDPKANSIKLFISGLSNETVAIDHNQKWGHGCSVSMPCSAPAVVRIIVP